YKDNKAEEVPCDFDCVDYNKDGIINTSDLDGVCDLDCYNNRTDIQRAYDIDCIFRNKEINDEICDPDTNGKFDGVCDPDCAKPNFICDFDCDGIVHDGNPSGLNDTDCYVCDKICNGFCSYACNEGDDPDCLEGFKGFFNLTECCNNSKCGSGENCENCPDDCPIGATCVDLNKVCCPDSFDSDDYGCSETVNLTRGKSCFCDNQCSVGLNCTETTEDFRLYKKACCDLGKQWNGTNCTDGICPKTISTCFNHWHWEHYGTRIHINDRQSSSPSSPATYDPYNMPSVTTCDMYEVCHPTEVKDIAKEIVSCCNDKCSGDCHTLCNRAVHNSGLDTTDTKETRKKCYGLYIIYGMGPAAAWTKGYKHHLEQPASIMLSQSTWMCTGYAIMLATLLRSVGYEKNEAYGTCGPGHMFNIVKFPGESRYRIVDTTGNKLYIAGLEGSAGYPYSTYGSGCNGCTNDEGAFSCPGGVIY
ncbi:MAG: hypothetical protein KAU95_00700, partial [Candidatus Aenigmarchaeota archaeon]|nr:hypothetical protein [Candidatus Aenigmarchaeota archaeon]